MSDLSGLLRRMLREAAGMVWPRTCEVCGRRLTASEQVMCLHCELGMPLTGLHLDSEFNEIHRRVAHRPSIARAAAMMHYIHGDPYTHLIHNAKYNHRPRIMLELGRRYGRELAASGFMDGIDMIEPVPTHWLKRLARGYNQTEWLARGLSEATGVPVELHLAVRRRHGSQTRHTRLMRWANASGAYCLDTADGLAGRHVLLVDDVITTGATLVSCADLLAGAAPGVTVSLAGIGLTKMNT